MIDTSTQSLLFPKLPTDIQIPPKGSLFHQCLQKEKQSHMTKTTSLSKFSLPMAFPVCPIFTVPFGPECDSNTKTVPYATTIPIASNGTSHVL